jgi:hypothetical protein
MSERTEEAILWLVQIAIWAALITGFFWLYDHINWPCVWK